MLIFVCSPLRGERPYTTAKYNRNLQKAADYSAAVVHEGHIPITPHLYFSHFIDDHKPQEREKGLEMSKELLRMCDQYFLKMESAMAGKARSALPARLGKQYYINSQDDREGGYRLPSLSVLGKSGGGCYVSSKQGRRNLETGHR